jgi:hypothetical protein
MPGKWRMTTMDHRPPTPYPSGDITVAMSMRLRQPLAQGRDGCSSFPGKLVIRR